ncbi:hypothetical protein ID866_965 [Astraeus odoratus]|nr:hypothetical protein ID866_965 [Astraeus odoratus]
MSTSTPLSSTTSAVTPASTLISPSTALSPGVIAGIAVGCVVAVALFVCLAIFLVRRRRSGRSGFERVDNPRQLRDMWAYSSEFGLHSQDSGFGGYTAYNTQQPSVSSRPLLASTGRTRSSRAWPRKRSSDSPLRPFREQSDTTLVADRMEQGEADDAFDPYAEIGWTPPCSGLISRGEITPPNIPRIAYRQSSPNRYASHSRFPSGDRTDRGMDDLAGVASNTSPHRPRTPLFINRSLKKPDGDGSPPATPRRADHVRFSPNKGTSIHGDDQTIQSIRDTQSSRLRFGSGDEESSIDPLPPVPTLSSPVVRSFDQRRASPGRARSPAAPSMLPPVAETPDLSQILNFVASQPPSTLTSSESDSAHARTSLLSANASHAMASRPSSVAVDENVPISLLTSTMFGKESVTSSASLSSNAGYGTGSSSSRYPSIVASTAGQCSGSLLHSGGQTDWHHPPAGLSGLKDLQVEPLRNPYSPVKSTAPLLPSPPGDSPSLHQNAQAGERIDNEKRARLRQSTSTSVPEVQRRVVAQGDIAMIDVTLT